MLICELEKNPKERIRVSIETSRNSTFVDLRVYWQDEAGDLVPGRNMAGAFPCDRPLKISLDKYVTNGYRRKSSSDSPIKKEKEAIL